jgi:transposase InsO family protein
VKNAKDAINFLNNQTENTVKLLRLDNGTEFVNEQLKEFFSEKGIPFGLNAPHNSQSNGMIERDVRTGQDAARAMLIQSKLSKQHWEDAMRTNCYLLNETLNSKNTEKTPYELKPSLHHVRVFGCKAFAHVMSYRNKWDAKFVECVLVGYNPSSKEPNERKFIEQARRVTFVGGSIAEHVTSKRVTFEPKHVAEVVNFLTAKTFQLHAFFCRDGCFLHI